MLFISIQWTKCQNLVEFCLVDIDLNMIKT